MNGLTCYTHMRRAFKGDTDGVPIVVTNGTAAGNNLIGEANDEARSRQSEKEFDGTVSRRGKRKWLTFGGKPVRQLFIVNLCQGVQK